jgi:putative ABC transport system permease protein
MVAGIAKADSHSDRSVRGAMFLTRRNLVQEKVRLIISVLGVALAIMLILLLDGLLSGMRRQITAYLQHAPGVVVVTQAGVNNLLGANSLLSSRVEEDARSIEGTARVVPVLSQTAFFDLHEKKVFVYLIGYDPAQGGGPWRLAEGREPREGREVIIDRVLARLHGLALGDELEVAGFKFPVVGLSEGTASWMASYVFIRKQALESLMLTPGLSSFLLVTPSPGMPPEALRERLRVLSGAEVWLKPELIASDLRLYGPFFKPIQLMAVIAFLVGTLVVGLVIYTATIERQREYGVLKAIGARNALLYQIVTAQAFIVAGLGAAVGILLAVAAAQLIMLLRPQFLVVLEPQTLTVALMAGLAMALLAALFPVRVIASLAPADVFRR